MFKKNKSTSATELEQQTITTVLGNDMKVAGNITGSSPVRIDGVVEGNISTQGGIIMGEKSQVTGDLNSDYIVIYGKLTGNIHAKGLYIKSTGVINGDITVDIIEIEVGGKYNGKLNMQTSSSPA